MTVRITLPTGMSLRDWADQVTLDLDPFGATGRLDDDAMWQEWAMQFVRNTSLKETMPIPYNYANWRDWAERFCQTIE